jgi:hypothetical protein
MSPFDACFVPRLRLFYALSALCVFSACGGGGSSGNNTTSSSSIPVAVAGLASNAKFVLKDASGDSLTISANGKISFPVQAASGAAYTLSVSTQPTGEFCNVQNGSGAVGSSSKVSVSCAQRLSGGTGSVAAAGGQFTSAAADVTVPGGSSLQAQNITVTTVAPPAGIPASLTPVGAAIDVSIDQPAELNAPLIVTLRYDASIVADETNLAVIHYNTTTNKYEPATVLAQDTTTHSFTIASRTFSPFLIVYFDPTVLLPASHMVTNFSPQNNGWNIDNSGNYFTKHGNCLGMAAFAIWYFKNEPDALNGKFSADGAPSIAQILAVRAQLAQSQYWAHASTDFLSTLGSAATAKLMKFYLAEFDEPLVFIMGDASAPYAHAGVLYGYDSSGFTFYDTNVENASQTVTFDGSSFGTYNGSQTPGDPPDTYTLFTYDAQPSLGRTEDFAELESEAAANFISSQYITVASPTPDAVVTSLPLTLQGSLQSNDPSLQLIAYIGAEIVSFKEVPSFSQTVNPPLGNDTIILLAGDEIATQNATAQQSNWYANSAAYIFDVNVQVPISIVPATPQLPLGATQTFSVTASLPGDINDYANYTFSWSLTGVGSIGTSSPVITTVPAIVYNALNKAGQATLSLSVLDPNGKTVGSTTDTITVGASTGTVTEEIFTFPLYVGDGTGQPSSTLMGYYGIPLVVFTPAPGYSTYTLVSESPTYVNGPLLLGLVYGTQLDTPDVSILVNGQNPPLSYQPPNPSFYNLGNGQVGFNVVSGTGGGFAYQSLTYGAETLTPAQAQAMVIAYCQSLLNFYNPIVLQQN